jgi:TusA-related sulfurtransferase
MEGKGHQQLDLRGVISPFVHLKVIQSLHGLHPGDTLSLVHIHPESLNDLMAILRHYPLQLGELLENDGGYTLQITKNAAETL